MFHVASLIRHLLTLAFACVLFSAGISWIVIVALVASGALPAIAVETPLPVRYALTAAPVNTAGVSPGVHVAIALP